MIKPDIIPISQNDKQIITDVCKAFIDLPLSGIAVKLRYILSKEITPYHYIYMGMIIGQLAQPKIIVSNSLN